MGDIFVQEYKPTKKQTVRHQLNEKKSKESQARLTSWYWKREPSWRKDLITYNNHSWIMFSFNWLFIIWKGGIRLKLNAQDQKGGRILDLDRQGGGYWKLDSFHGRHMCITPKGKKGNFMSNVPKTFLLYCQSLVVRY